MRCRRRPPASLRRSPSTVLETHDSCDGDDGRPVVASSPSKTLPARGTTLKGKVYYVVAPATTAVEWLANYVVAAEILDSFQDTEFWYAEQGTISGNSTRSRGGSFRRIVQRKDEKWWLPVPCVHLGGLIDKSRKHLNEKRDCANQIHKAAMAINSSALAEMDIPETYMSNLPKHSAAEFSSQDSTDSAAADCRKVEIADSAAATASKSILAVVAEIVLVGGAEYYRIINGLDLEDKLHPGGPFDPLGLAKDPDQAALLKVKEIKNGRLAMFAMLGFYFQAYVTGEGPVENLAKHLSDPFGNNLLTVIAGSTERAPTL
ncbi:hypothetical protein JHK85_013373 [Glycine max]|uniref:Chlorophyll a-b binding protein, chloroplastic n=1 Tax=Glycine max TaxID=3847 RepID=K7KQB7_SOYBN|nr:hypothetical protein JHK85_013373 [Glycine max]KAG5058037.1 hypothetical protein JHK86_013033 [Glycine max]